MSHHAGLRSHFMVAVIAGPSHCILDTVEESCRNLLLSTSEFIFCPNTLKFLVILLELFEDFVQYFYTVLTSKVYIKTMWIYPKLQHS